jgi:hypothetical protein
MATFAQFAFQQLPGTILEPGKTDAEGLTKLITNLFDRWNLTGEEQLELLGLSAKSRSLLSAYRKGGKNIPSNRDTIERVTWLLSIHKALRLLYPRNPEIRYTWVKRRNMALNNLTPLEIMRQGGILGLTIISRHLDYQRGI